MSGPARGLVAIGGSAGGVEALKTIVSALPADLPAAVLVGLHLPATARSYLADILQRRSTIDVCAGRGGPSAGAGTRGGRPPGRAPLAVGGQPGGHDVRRAIELAFVASSSAQVVVDANGVVQVLNERAERDLRLRRGDIGRQFAELEISRRPLELRGAVGAVQASAEPVELSDVEATALSGDTRWWDVRIAPLRDGDAGEVLGVHLVFDDVTERHVMAEQMQLMSDQLASACEELQTLNDELRERTVEVDQVNDFLHGILADVVS